MRIPSIAKIKKQIDMYVYYQYIPKPEEYYTLYKEYASVYSKWDNLIKNCPANQGGICNCKEHPKYKEIAIDKIQNLANQINKITFEYDKKIEQYKTDLFNRAMKTREAKIKFKK
jgi:hypothetical protein